jgi:hypothetical protein
MQMDGGSPLRTTRLAGLLDLRVTGREHEQHEGKHIIGVMTP